MRLKTVLIIGGIILLMCSCHPAPNPTPVPAPVSPDNRGNHSQYIIKPDPKTNMIRDRFNRNNSSRQIQIKPNVIIDR